jgi:hypothetical protein
MTRQRLRTCALSVAVLLGACATSQPVTQVGLNRDTPEATFQYFKAVAAANQWRAEWSTFSPEFKRRLNQAAGRNVDFGDYELARQTMAPNSSSEMQMLLTSTLVNVSYPNGPDGNAALVTVQGGGRQATFGLVKLTSWELKIRGQAEPFSDLVRSPADVVSINPDGSVTARVPVPQYMGPVLRTFSRDQIEAFAVKAQWYVNDFGGLDQALGAGGAAAPPPGPGTAPPPATPDTFAPPPPADMGSPG